ncbi:TatD family hydrolase [Aeromicrobium chenweiae]|uniref:AraC family transcriptional regulator n=1 Tax=Aeromicrobium chenweiae TaxID=2079793 RepID=A0A2S0WJ87_9ACTN|nr:TatD family hydrolase [Aeromicrobium chenweiae]AWB91399.1 AraC family transcriptional regulator [Aeromicrobium chenweiae]TGN30670.1 TatD family deoxyribonuclease [Aeromicrobium chenweiae]
MTQPLTAGWPETPEALPSPVVDNHCHLDHRAYSKGVEGGLLIPVDEALDRAAAVNVTRIVQVGCDLEGSQWAVDTAAAYESVVAAVALHPNEAPVLAAAGELDAALAEIDRLAQSGDHVRAIGETGLDYFRTGVDGREAQHVSFREHIRIAKRHDKTLVIHDRDAHDDVIAVLDDEGVPDRVVMHCFSGDADFARACLDRGAYLSFAGTVTFKNAENLRAALRVTPADRILVETDAPFLTPTPHRGQPNASFLVPLTVRFMAGIAGKTAEELCRDIDANTDRAFGGPWAQRT